MPRTGRSRLLRAVAIAVMPAVAAASVVLGVASASAATPTAGSRYHVDCQAAADGEGTSAAPISTLAGVAALQLQPGDVVLFKRGTVCHGVVRTQGSGTADLPIVIDAYGDGDQLPRIDGDGVDATVQLSNQQHWEIRNLEITNTDASTAARYTAMRRGVVVANSDAGKLTHIRLEDLYIHDVTGQNKKDLGGSGGIQLEVSGSTVPSWFDDVVIAGNRIEDVNRSGINMSTSWLCRAEMGWDSAFCTRGNAAKNPWTPSTGLVIRDNSLDGIGGDGIVVQMNDGAVVEGNVVNDAANRANQGSNAGVWSWNADNTVFQHNTVSNTNRLAGNNDGTSYDIDYGTRNTVFQYNTSYGNDGGMLFFCGCAAGWLPDAGFASEGVYRYNVSIAEENRSGFLAGATDGAFYNNTFVVSDPSQTTLLSVGDGNSILAANNLFVSLTDAPLSYSSGTANVVAWRANGFFGSGTTWPGTAADGNVYQPASALSPELRAAFQTVATAVAGDQALGELDLSALAVADPALAGKGIPVAEEGATDFYGNTIPSRCAPDIGAYQFSAFDDTACGVPATLGAGQSATFGVPATSTLRVAATITPGAQLTVANVLGRVQTARASDADPARVYAVVRTTGDDSALTTACAGGECTDISVTTVADAVVDGSFESPYTSRTDRRTSPWGNWNAGRSTTSVISGVYSLSLTGTSGASAEQTGVPVDGGAAYDLGGWVTSTRTGSAGTTIGVKWTGGEVNVTPTVTNALQYRTTRVVVPAGVSPVTVYCWQPSGATGTSYCDDLTLTKAVPAAPTPVTQPRSTVVAEGDTAHLRAAFRSDLAYALRWESSRDGESWSPVATTWSGSEVGVASPALSVAGLTTADSGIRYRAVATTASTGAETVSDVAVVEVTPPRAAVAPTWDVATTVSTRCVAGKVVLVVTAENGEDAALAVVLSTPYGTRTADLGSGAKASYAFSTRLTTMPAGAVTTHATGTANGVETSAEGVVAYDPRTCS